MESLGDPVGFGEAPHPHDGLHQMHANFYARHSGFGQRFESMIARGLAEFGNRLDSPCNSVRTAVRDGSIVGSVAIDGEDLGINVAHLRRFIVDDGVRDGGVGRKLLSAALEFVDRHGFAETHLWTFNGCTKPMDLLAWRRKREQNKKKVRGQRFVRLKPRVLNSSTLFGRQRVRRMVD